MKTRILREDYELAEFGRRFAKRGNPVTLEYLRRSRVRGFFDKRGILFAGYALNRSWPLRYLDWIPKAEQTKLPLDVTPGKCCEITCIWIHARPGRLSSEVVYLQSVLDALASGAAFTLGGTIHSVVYGIQSQALPRLLYTGPPACFPERPRCWVYGASRRQLLGWLGCRFPRDYVRALLGRPTYLSTARRRARLDAGVQSARSRRPAKVSAA